MPTPKAKQPNTAKAAAPAATDKPVPEAQAASPKTDAAVIAELVRGGMPYAEAKAAVEGEAPTAPTPQRSARRVPDAAPAASSGDDEPEPEITDPGENLETFEVPRVPREGYTMAEELYELREKISRSRKKALYKFEVTVDSRLMDWLIHATIAEAAFRGRAELSLSDFSAIRFKELKAADPSHGGRRTPSKSGPRDQYNPTQGNWKPGN